MKRAERRKKVCSVCIYAIQTSVVGIEGGGECSIRLVPQKNERRRRRRETSGSIYNQLYCYYYYNEAKPSRLMMMIV